MNIHIAKNYQTDEIIYKSYMCTIVGHWIKIENTEIQHKTKNNIFLRLDFKNPKVYY